MLRQIMHPIVQRQIPNGDVAEFISSYRFQAVATKSTWWNLSGMFIQYKTAQLCEEKLNKIVLNMTTNVGTYMRHFIFLIHRRAT